MEKLNRGVQSMFPSQPIMRRGIVLSWNSSTRRLSTLMQVGRIRLRGLSDSVCVVSGLHGHFVEIVVKNGEVSCWYAIFEDTIVAEKVCGVDCWLDTIPG